MINFFKKIYYEKYSQKSYSASPVDLVINRIFRGKKKGYYIDLGCNHPIKYSNTYLLHQRGWQGINIDADKESIIQFNRFRKNDVNKNISVSSKIGFKKFYIYHSRSALNTFERNLVKKRKAKPIKIEMVETDTLNNIIENSKFKKKI